MESRDFSFFDVGGEVGKELDNINNAIVTKNKLANFIKMEFKTNFLKLSKDKTVSMLYPIPQYTMASYKGVSLYY